MVNITGIPSLIINTLENYRTVVFAVVVVFKVKRNASVRRKVLASKGVVRERAVTSLNKKIRAVYNPVAVHTCVVWYHI